jgi:ABC-type antimicrobial peptide transport system permease subunit
MDAAIGTSLALREAFSWLLAVFASLALVLAIGGAYGVASYLVTQRRREIGIRVALGARTSDILRTVIVRGLTVAAVGVAAGLVASLALARMLADADALVGVRARDPEILAFVAAVLVGTALLANGLPARRAAHTDPMGALRID